MGISSIIILPLIVLFIIIYGFIKKVDIYDEFLNGALDGLKTTIKIIPNLVAMIFAINILIKSNIITDSFFFLDNVLKRFSLSSEIIPMCFLRSISGNSTLAIMVDIFKEFGPDSVMGTLASVIQGSSDTTFYVIALYFGLFQALMPIIGYLFGFSVNSILNKKDYVNYNVQKQPVKVQATKNCIETQKSNE